MGLVSTLAHPDCQRSGTLQGSALAVEPRWYVPPSCSHDATGIIFFFFFFLSWHYPMQDACWHPEAPLRARNADTGFEFQSLKQRKFAAFCGSLVTTASSHRRSCVCYECCSRLSTARFVG